MRNIGSRQGATDQVSIILMVVAFLSMIGLMFWLSKTAEPTAPPVVEEEAAPEERMALVSAADFGMDSGSFENDTIRMQNLTVASRMGDQAFWVNIPRQASDGTILPQPYLVKMDSATAAEIRVRSGDEVNVEGYVVLMPDGEKKDSILANWDSTGVINANNRIEAEFASEFFEALLVELLAADTDPTAEAN